ncbi:hypothetical protein OG735_24850 [Streptomyces sp. NBC_01210]|uniref:hypothetical protein n=1 Tax=Streptomyces sp. NBC_01210 TaxID=2903774 RepID=UPI002E1586A6|nr:hypothetical protein OG735_24850 [Streptomyces sp. NBC_01210]
MNPVLVLVVVALIGFGFMEPVLWVAAAVLVFGHVRYGRGGSRSGGRRDMEYREYRDRRDHQARLERRYQRENRGRLTRQARRQGKQPGGRDASPPTRR